MGSDGELHEMFWGCWIWLNVLPQSDRYNDVCICIWCLEDRVSLKEFIWVSLYHHKWLCSTVPSRKCTYIGVMFSWVIKVHNGTGWASIVTAFAPSAASLQKNRSAHFVSKRISMKFSWFVWLAIVQSKGYMPKAIASNTVLPCPTFCVFYDN